MMSFLKMLDMFKVQANFFMYQNLKSKGEKYYTRSYGSYVGFLLTMFTFTIGIYFLYSEIGAMLIG